MAAPELSESELKFVSGLVRREVHFLIVGLSAAALQGAPVVTQDVDLWFEDLSDPRIREALREVGAAFVPSFELNPPMFAGGGLELFDIVSHMHGLRPFPEEYKVRLTLPLGASLAPVLPLDRIVASKRASNRPKDRLVLPVLEDALRTSSHRSGE